MSWDLAGHRPTGALSRARRSAGRVAGLAACGVTAVLLTGCSVNDDFPAACADVRAEEESLRLEITEQDWPSEQDRVATERRWAELIVGEPECFTPERVAIASTLLQSPWIG